MMPSSTQKPAPAASMNRSRSRSAAYRGVLAIRTARAARGAALITSMIVLGVLALLGVSTMTATNTELQIATNLEDRTRSFQAAEAGIAAAAAVVEADSDELSFPGTSKTIDPTLGRVNLLAPLGSDKPTVTASITGDPVGKCERSESASSDDLIGCGAYELQSAHGAGNSGVARNAATTTLRLGLSRQIIASY